MNRAGYANYKMKLKVLSSLFIGGGEDAKLSRLDYIYDESDKTVYVLDQNKWIRFLKKCKLLDDYLNLVMAEARKKSGGLDNYGYLVSRQRVFRQDIKDLMKEITSRKLSTSGFEGNFKNNDIYCFIRNSEGKPFIPGSSIKGAIRTAIMCMYYTLNREKADNDFSMLGYMLSANEREKKKREKIAHLCDRFESSIFDWRENIGNNSYLLRGMSGILVSDSTPFPESYLFLDRKRSVVLKDGREEKESTIPFYREYAMPGTEVEFSLSIDTYKIKRELGINSIEDIMKALQYRWESIFGKSGILRLVPEIDKYIPNDISSNKKSGLLILGGGAGFHSKSVITSIAPSSKGAVLATKKILHMNFPVKKHMSDNPVSPRALKLSRYKSKDRIIGVCEIGVIQK